MDIREKANFERIKEQFRNSGKKKKKKDPNAWLTSIVAKEKAGAKAFNTEDHIYGLFIDNYFDMEDCVYVGRTDGLLSKRLARHKSEIKTGTSKKCLVLRSLIEEGHEIHIKLFETIDRRETYDAEDKWYWECKNAGAKLLNGKRCDDDRQIVVMPEKVEKKKKRKAFSQNFKILSLIDGRVLFEGSTCERSLKKYIKTTVENLTGVDEQDDVLDELIRAINDKESMEIVKV